jgi:hypothetical protein
MEREDFQVLHELGKLSRAQAQQKNVELLPALRTKAEEAGVRIELMSDHHWNVYLNDRCLAQFWPTKNKFQHLPTGKLIHGTAEDMLNHVIRRL